jgi:hypothetical protein
MDERLIIIQPHIGMRAREDRYMNEELYENILIYSFSDI